MSVILQYADKEKIKLTGTEKDKLISMEVMLNLSEINIEIADISLLLLKIKTKNYNYHIITLFDKFRVNIYEETNKKRKKFIIQKDLISAVEFCITHLRADEIINNRGEMS